MRRVIFFLITTILLYHSGCNSNDEEKELADVFSVHLQYSYNNTPVNLELDGNVILIDTISTGQILAFAAIVDLEVYNGEHKLWALIEGAVNAETTFVVEDTLFVSVNYIPDQNRIYFRSQRWPWMYR